MLTVSSRWSLSSASNSFQQVLAIGRRRNSATPIIVEIVYGKLCKPASASASCQCSARAGMRRVKVGWRSSEVAQQTGWAGQKDVTAT